MKNYINIIINNRSYFADCMYTYSCDEEVQRGAVVRVPFGKKNRAVTGYVVETGVEPDTEMLSKIKDIYEVDQDISLTEEMVETALWMRTRYGLRYIDAIRCFVPSKKCSSKGRKKMPYKDVALDDRRIEKLTPEQRMAVMKITAPIRVNKNRIFLLKGVTSSGKTEVYIKAAEETLKQGRTVIILVPEITLVKQLVERLAGYFGRDRIAVLHSRLTARERYDEWMRLRNGEAVICIGARTAVFAPLTNVGLIVMDEEHETTYKSDQTPKYDTVDIAAKRLIYSKGVMVLGSATPSVVSYHRASEGTYKLIQLRHRYNRTKLPRVEIVDMKKELRQGNRGIFSGKLYAAMKDNLTKGRQVVLFLNRRGYSTFISCKDCGEAIKCPDCGISLVYHKTENRAVCHYCGRRFKLPEKCDFCGSKRLQYFGVGTEQVEEKCREIFPENTVERLDIDTVLDRRKMSAMLDRFSDGTTDILVGTQLVAKGLDVANVGLTGVIFADAGLNIPDYRAGERTFQLITQAAGRAGRGDEQGLVIVQTLSPDNFSVVAASKNDYEGFYKKEVTFRKLMEYPPFTDIIMALFTHKKEEVAMEVAEKCRDYLKKANLPNSEKIFEPRSSENFKGTDGSRYQLMIKCPKGQRNKYMYYLSFFNQQLVEKKSRCSMIIDVNPYSM